MAASPNTRAHARALRYGAALVASAAAVLARLALGPVLGDAAPLLLFVLPVILSAWYGGLGPGLIATAVCAIVGSRLFMPALGRSAPDLVRLAIFVIEGTFISVVSGRLRGARARLEHDAAELHRSREELARSQAHLSGIVESAMDAIITVDVEQRILVFNRAAEQIFGYRAADMLGHPLDALLPSHARERHRSHIRAFGETGVTTRSMQSPGMLTAVRQSGEEFPIEATIAQFTLEGERFYTVILRDITERVRADEQHRMLERSMQETQRLESLGVMAGGMAHDFNNLLSGVLGYAELALERLEPGTPAREEIEQIQQAARRAAELTGQMLAYSGRGRFLVAPLDLGDLVRDMGRLLESSAPRSATLQIRRGQGELWIAADASQMRQAVMNLVINAGEALGEAIGTISVTVERRDTPLAAGGVSHAAADMPPPPYVVLSVADTGSGIAPDALRRIFEPFFTTKFTGRGLGLAAVVGIIRGHRGALRVTSELGAGTTFEIALPAVAAPQAAAHVPPAPAVARDGRTVLVVDDEASVRTLVARALERIGLVVLTAEDGQAAVELLHAGTEVHGVLLDMTMPRMSGPETFQVLRAERPELPVILMSGYSAEEVASALPDAAIYGVLQKPFSARALRAAVQDMLEQAAR